MKKYPLLALLALLLPACSTTQSADNSTAIIEPALTVSITSRGNGMDKVAYKEVQRLISAAENQGIINVSRYRHGKEGGFSACLLNKQTTDSSAFNALVADLQTISVDNHTTAYLLTPSQTCTPR